MLLPLSAVTLHLPFEVADYVDFYAREHHATNVGRIFRPDGRRPDAQLEAPADRLPRPRGHRRRLGHGRGPPAAGSARPPTTPRPSSAPRVRLDIEAEVGFVVGAPSRAGPPGADWPDFRDHVFGVCLLNDWSARDIQAWEYVPLGPFLGKSFATSVSAWVTPLDALDAARVAPPARDTPLLPYLDDARRGRAGRLRPADLGAAERPRGLRAALRRDVLDGRAAAGPHDGERRVAAHRRPLRVGHGQRPRARTSAARSSN